MHNHGADHQPKMYIDQSMRTIVISWLVEVACEYELHQETLFLSAALLDRFMSLSKVMCLRMCSYSRICILTACTAPCIMPVLLSLHVSSCVH